MKSLELLKNMIISGANNLYNNYPYIDKLNVFPVPDGDTGTNMNLTISNGVNEINDNTFNSLGDFLASFARGLVLGARGNSGVIFSQIIKGLSLGMSDTKELSVSEWKKGFKKASEVAYKSVMNPIEGTILTVIRETSQKADELNDDLDIKEFWNKIIKASNKSLNNTPNLLPVLKEVGVVDSGGYGLVKFLEGMQHYVSKQEIIKKLSKLEKNDGNNIEFKVEQEFGYCTEAIVILQKKWINNLDPIIIKDQLELYKNTSIVIVIDENILKVHTHALSPGQVLLFLQQYGDFRTLKIENMNIQANKHIKGGMPEWKESSTIKLERNLVNDAAIISVVSSPQLKQYFEEELGADIAIDAGSNMNPSTEEFLKAIEKADAKNVFILPNNSNVYLAAKQAEKLEEKSKIYVIQTKTIQQGLVCTLNYDPSLTPSKNYSNLSKATKNVISFTTAKSDRDTTVNGVNVKKDHVLATVEGKIVGCEKTMKIIFEKHLAKYIKSKTEIITIFAGEEADKKDLTLLRKFLDEKYDVEYEIIESGQKVYSLLIAIE